MNNIDQKYLTAIQNNDMQTVKNIVKDVASKNGYTIEAYHGTWHKFDEFKTPAYFTTDKRYAKMFTVTDEDKDIIPVYLKLKKPLDLSKYGTKKYGWKSFLKILKDNNIDITDSVILKHIEYVSNDYIWFYMRKLTQIDEHTNKIKNLFISSGYDSIIQYDFIDRKISNKFLTYIVFNPNQIKSAELIIKDKNRDIVPITQRFNSDSDKFFENILSFKQFLLEYDIDTFEKYFNQFKQETDYSVEDIAKTLGLDLGNNIEENWNKIKEEIGKLFNEVEKAYENWKGGDSDSHYYAVEISSTDFDTMLDEYISENGAYSLQYIDSEIDDKFFNKILEKRMESYNISTEFASHGFLFNDGSSIIKIYNK